MRLDIPRTIIPRNAFIPILLLSLLISVLLVSTGCNSRESSIAPPQDDLSIEVLGTEQWQPPEGQPGQGRLLNTTRGDIEAIIHQDSDSTVRSKAILWVSGASGGFNGPGDGVYRVLAEELKPQMTSLRINYRHPGDLQESVLDTLAGIEFLEGTGHTNIVLVGHSFGGAVVISAAPNSPSVKAVVALSSQTFGANNAADVSPRPLLLVHGEEDMQLPPHLSQKIYDWAKEPKELVLYPDAGHSLRERKDELHDLLRDWIIEKSNQSPL